MRLSTKTKLKNDLVIYPVVSMAFLIVGVAFWIALEHSNEAKRWTKVDATIYKMTTKERREKHGTSWVLSIYLKYKFNGKTGVYIDRSNISRTKAKVVKIADNYVYGDKMKIYVNPENPIECVKDPNLDSIQELIGVVLFGLISVILFIIYRVKRAQYKRLD